MSKSITVHFKIPLPQNVLKRLANFFNVEIIEKIPNTMMTGTKMSSEMYVHTIPQQKIDAWDSKRHNQDDVETLKNEVGFHIKNHGISGTIYYVDSSTRVCEFYWEFSGVAIYDILVSVNRSTEWFLPVKEKVSLAEKNEIIEKMKIWLVEQKIKADFY